MTIYGYSFLLTALSFYTIIQSMEHTNEQFYDLSSNILLITKENIGNKYETKSVRDKIDFELQKYSEYYNKEDGTYNRRAIIEKLEKDKSKLHKEISNQNTDHNTEITPVINLFLTDKEIRYHTEKNIQPFAPSFHLLAFASFPFMTVPLSKLFLKETSYRKNLPITLLFSMVGITSTLIKYYYTQKKREKVLEHKLDTEWAINTGLIPSDTYDKSTFKTIEQKANKQLKTEYPWIGLPSRSCWEMIMNVLTYPMIACPLTFLFLRKKFPSFLADNEHALSVVAFGVNYSAAMILKWEYVKKLIPERFIKKLLKKGT